MLYRSCLPTPSRCHKASDVWITDWRTAFSVSITLRAFSLRGAILHAANDINSLPFCFTLCLQLCWLILFGAYLFFDVMWWRNNNLKTGIRLLNSVVVQWVCVFFPFSGVVRDNRCRALFLYICCFDFIISSNFIVHLFCADLPGVTCKYILARDQV